MSRFIASFRHGILRNALASCAARGQVVIMFAVVSVSLIGMMGLAIDGGFYLYARRTAQAAADAAALAGARQLSRSNSAQTEAVSVAAANGQGGVKPAVVECRYVDDANAVVSAGTTCGAPPASASGVRVRTQATVPTFFLNVIPGAPQTAVAAGRATARVQIVKPTGSMGANAPFIVCGNVGLLASGGTMNIVESTSPFKLNPNAIGKTFRIHDSNLGEADCSAQGNSFKGLADQDENGNRTVPGWFAYDDGTKAGPTRADVSGPGGCKANTPPPYNCVVLLPLATDSPTPSKNPPEIYVYGFAAFEISQAAANAHNGKLIGSYPLTGEGENGWKPGDGRMITIRLTE
jgi:Flp pilus assembly protein TadG